VDRTGQRARKEPTETILGEFPDVGIPAVSNFANGRTIVEESAILAEKKKEKEGAGGWGLSVCKLAKKGVWAGRAARTPVDGA